MNSFSAFLRSFLVADRGHSGYRQPSANNEEGSLELEPERLSASVSLDDLIDEYDEPSRWSRSVNDVPSSSYNLTTATSNPGGHPSQSYVSLSTVGGGHAGRDVGSISSGGPDHEETTSFYSALQDGFSVDEFELRNKYGREFFWNTSGSFNPNGGNGDGSGDCERDIMLERSDFQIIWTDLSYTVRPRAPLTDLWDEFKSKLTDGLSSAPGFCSIRKTKTSYNVSERPAAGGGADSSSSVPTKILENVNGSFRSGQLTAILGPSGAGKTSLLNILSRRLDDGLTGRVDVADANRRITINSIPQDDHLLECLSVRENLTFASRLKNPHPNQDHQQNVCKVSNFLGLDECLDTRTSKISGGQQKRLAIAQELLSKPDILILDEPTSGLDSLTCLKTLSVLKDLVKVSKRMINPIAIVLTIHQPQREALEMFDKVYVMAHGGTTIYDGPPSGCTRFIETHSGLKMPDSDCNPASFLIEIASGEFGQEPIDALARQVRLDFQKRQAKLVSTRAETGQTNKPTNSISLSATNCEIHPDARGPNSAPTSPTVATNWSQNSKQARLYLDPQLVKSSQIDSGKFLLKTKILTGRCWSSLWRDPKQVLARVALHFLLPFGIAFIMGTDPGRTNACPHFQNEYSLKRVMLSDEYTSPQVQEDFLLSLENNGILFVAVYACISADIAVMTLVLALDMRNCLKEYHNGWYSMTSYVFARLLSNIPLDLILPTATMGLIYFTTGQNAGTAASGELSDFYRVIIMVLGVIIASMTGQVLGMIFGVIYAGHITTALFASQGACLPFVLLSGFVARTKNMSKFVRALSFSSFYRHCLEVAFIARYGYNVCGCKPQDVANQTVVLTGVPDELKTFIKFWMNSQGDETTTPAIAATTSAGAVPAPINPNDTSPAVAADQSDDDIFQIVAKQISLYNTYGVEVKSCAAVKPYLLHDFGLTESDLPASFGYLVILFLVSLLILMLVVKLIVSYRTSL